MKVHLTASLFPEMSPEEYASLKADIAEHGLIEPIRTHKGQILDGRHRYKACQELGIKPRFQAWRGDPVALVWSANSARRHLTQSQRAMLIVKLGLLRKPEREARGRMLSGRVAMVPVGRSRDIVAAQSGVSGRYIQYAKAAATAGIKGLEAAVISGAVPLKDAARFARRVSSDDPQAVIAVAQGLPAMRALEKGWREGGMRIKAEIAGDERNLDMFGWTESDVRRMRVGSRLEKVYAGFLADPPNARLLARIKRFLVDGRWLTENSQKLAPALAIRLADECEKLAASFRAGRKLLPTH